MLATAVWDPSKSHINVLSVEELMAGGDPTQPTSESLGSKTIPPPGSSKLHSELLALFNLAEHIYTISHKLICRPTQIFWLIDNGLRVWFLSRPNWTPEEFLQLSQAFRCVYSSWIFCWKQACDIRQQVRMSHEESINKKSEIDIEALRKTPTPAPSLSTALTENVPAASNAIKALSELWSSMFTFPQQPTQTDLRVPAKVEAVEIGDPEKGTIVNLELLSNDSPRDQVTHRMLRLKEIIARSVNVNINSQLTPASLWKLIAEDYIWQSSEFLPSVVQYSQSKRIVDIMECLVVDPNGEYSDNETITTGMCTETACPHGNENRRVDLMDNLPPSEDLTREVLADAQDFLSRATKRPFWDLHTQSLLGLRQNVSAPNANNPTESHFLSEVSLFHHLGWLSIASSSLPETVTVNIKPRNFNTSITGKEASFSLYQWHIKASESDTCTTISIPEKHLALIVAIASVMAREISCLELQHEEHWPSDKPYQDALRFKIAECNFWEHVHPLKTPLINTMTESINSTSLASLLLETINTQKISLSSLDQVHLRNILRCYSTCESYGVQENIRRKIVVCSPGCKKHNKEQEHQTKDRWPEAAYYLNHYPFLAISMLRLMILPFGSMELVEFQAENRQHADNIVYPSNIPGMQQTGFARCFDLIGNSRIYGGDLMPPKNSPVRFFVK